ncbi:hypothetical protein HGM15179_008665 [Zosterops borbonicus]|uniref:Uncharacterized protein n=1 Tax=Zosterops borbonicus TaxID=364589 RepID=A0A8K1LLJ2_9PASS|nr:hypothetical protein HGM15179_008665 [Zosterops borbonicus]
MESWLLHLEETIRNAVYLCSMEAILAYEERQRKQTRAMVVPDIELVSKMMLAAEGFIDACLLARKFITL